MNPEHLANLLMLLANLQSTVNIFQGERDQLAAANQELAAENARLIEELARLRGGEPTPVGS